MNQVKISLPNGASPYNKKARGQSFHMHIQAKNIASSYQAREFHNKDLNPQRPLQSIIGQVQTGGVQYDEDARKWVVDNMIAKKKLSTVSPFNNQHETPYPNNMEAPSPQFANFRGYAQGSEFVS